MAAWRQRAASSPALDLPVDRPRRPGSAGGTGTVQGRVAAAAPGEVLAAWAALLHRLGGSARFALAASLDGREARLVEVDAGDDPPFTVFAERLLGAAGEPGEAGSSLPAPDLPAALAAAPGEPPAVRVAFGCDTGGACDLALTLAPAEGADGLAVRLAYAADLLDRATAERHLARLATLLAAARERPATPLSALSYLPPEEIAELSAWGRGPALPAERSPGAGTDAAEQRLERRFAAQAAATPDALAVAGGGVAWSYAELARRAAGIAVRLRRHGLRPGHRVGVLAERRPEMVAALLGILEAGCAYVPLDAKHPAERLAFVLADAGAAAVLAHRRLLAALPAEAPPVLLLDPDEESRNDESPDEGSPDEGSPAGEAADGNAVHAEPSAPVAPSPPPDAARLAYLIYTSGSTGRPKGVAIEHRSAAALLAWAAEEFSAAELAGVAAVTSIGFDLSVFEIFLPLARGGTVVLFDDALGLAEHRGEPPVTLINTVPSAIAELARLGGIPPTATTINLAGEPLHRDLVERLHALPHVERVLDLYGPSEDTTYSTFSVVERGADRPVTIGRPVAGTRVHLLDRRLRPVGVGVAGELCLGGAGLARGYLGRPARTAGAFVPDPFAADAGAPAGARLYRTGDLARWLPDGRLDFLGRLDHQVKLRGFRIELGEIESALTRHPAVGEAVVVVHRDGGDPRLVAYWAARPEEAPGASPPAGPAVLRQDLARTLPEYMLPAQWVRLPALPRNANGKIDRRALPAPPTGRDTDTPLRLPGSDLEAFLATLWRELLSLDEVGADDDLFALGGHSLVATRIAARVRDELGVHLPPADLFEHRTVSRLARRIEALRDGGPGATGAAAPAPEPPPLRRYGRDRRLPLAFPQEQVWLIHRLDPANLAYNFQYTVRLRGPLELPVLARALTEIVRRHEVLRTTFPAVDGEPAQVIHPPWPARVPLVDLTALPPERRGPVAEELAELRVRRSFDVTRLPLLDWTLLRIEAGDHLFVQAEQHFVHDGWSIGVILSELEALYTAFAAGRPSPLPELPVQYADFALWQREWMSGEALAGQLAYWRGRLADPPPPLELPSDRPRGRRLRFRGDRLDLDVPPALYARLREVGRGEGWTLFMLMLAAFQALLARYTGRDDFLLGSGVANRRLRESEPLIGMIVNTLVLRADLGGEPTFRELLARVRDSALGLQAHQDLPFEKLVAVLQPERDLSRNPLFQHMFSFHDAPVPDLEFAGLSGELVERHNGSAKADYNVIVKPRGSQRLGRAPSPEDEVLRVLWEFSTDLFDRTTIERAWGHYLVLLEAMTADRDQPVGRAPLLTAAEARQLAAWNDTAAPFAVIDAAAEVAARAAEAPQRPAVVAPEGTLSYGELAAGARRLAARLAAWGVGDETVVAVALPSSPEMVTAILAVATAGGAYLPLDPDHPAERLAYTLGDSGARVLITSAAVRAALPAFAGRVVTLPEADGAEDAAPPPRPRPRPEGLAYVIYTSGSTGRPKGTGLTRRGLANLVAWHVETYGVTAADRATLVASPAFDASVWELWPYLVRGAALHLPPPEVRSAPRELYRWLADEAITLAFLPTPLAEAMLEEEPPPGLALRALLVGGDRLHRPAAAGLPFRLVNHYGPTEDTVVTTAGVAGAGAAGGRMPPPIGRPIANTRVHLLDRRLEPVPVGVPGEVYVGGDGLARGYLERPALTAERFVPDPLAGDGGDGGDPGAGGRLYRTGDLARRLPDGQIDFLGRLDHQVKLRGFRIELGEIEVLLEGHPQVGRAAVVAVASPGAAATPDAGDAAALAAFVTLRGGADAAAAPAALAAHLAAHLPGYMVPESVTPLAELPLSPTGKVDRGALAERAARRVGAGAAGGGRGGSRVAPRDHGERLVAEIWADVLGLGAAVPLGVHDDFFALGGHSLRAAKAAARVGDAFGLELELPALFEHPTVAALSAHVAQRLAAGEAAGAIPRLAPAAKAAGVPLSYAQERLWLIDRIIERPSTYHVARAWACRGALDVPALAAAVATVVVRHEPLRTALVEAGGEAGGEAAGGGAVQRVVPAAEAPVPLPVVDLSALAAGRRADEERRILAIAVEQPFDLARPPLLRTALLRRGGDEHVLVLVLHHVVADGWSMPKLAAELGAAYGAHRDGDAARLSELPDLPVHYADFADWQRGRLEGEVLERLATFWRRHLAGAAAVLELPADRPRAAARSHAGGRVAARLDADTTGALRALACEHRATLFMALLAGLSALLGRHGGQDDVVIGTPVAGRTRRELDDLVGFFVNTLALRTRLGPGLDGREPSFAALLDRVRETTVAAFAHQEMPFERLVELLTPERDLGHSPVFQVTLALEAGGGDTPELAGCRVEALPVERREAHFELTLFAGERDDGALDLAFTYDRDLFDATTVERLAGRLAHLLAAACAEPQRPVALLPLMAAAERRQVARWSAAGGPAAARVVLDRHLQPVPPGVPGEVYAMAAAAGDGPPGADGDGPTGSRPAATVPNPLAGEPGHRAGSLLRATGELARWCADGTFEPRGRLADQVEVAGVRVDLGALDAAVSALPGVAEGAVVLRRDGGRDHLVAYAVPMSGEGGRGEPAPDPQAAAGAGTGAAAGPEPTAEPRELLRLLCEPLPSSARPTALVLVGALPRTAEGRPDRAALAALDGAAATPAPPAVAPRTPGEERLAALWGEILPVPPRSVHDDFFTLGGHSLLASRLVVRVRESFGVELPLRGVFRAPTLAGLAAEIVRLEAQEGNGGRAGAAARAPGSAPGNAPGSGARPTIRRVERIARRRPPTAASGDGDGR